MENQVKLKNCIIEELKIMNKFKKSIFAAFAVVVGISLTTACSDANEFEDTNTNNKSWVINYNAHITKD